jgi:hypothetical protein
MKKKTTKKLTWQQVHAHLSQRYRAAIEGRDSDCDCFEAYSKANDTYANDVDQYPVACIVFCDGEVGSDGKVGIDPWFLPIKGWARIVSRSGEIKVSRLKDLDKVLVLPAIDQVEAAVILGRLVEMRAIRDDRLIEIDR